jgi:hypothetical protein
VRNSLLFHAAEANALHQVLLPNATPCEIPFATLPRFTHTQKNSTSSLFFYCFGIFNLSNQSMTSLEIFDKKRKVSLEKATRDFLIAFAHYTAHPVPAIAHDFAQDS